MQKAVLAVGIAIVLAFTHSAKADDPQSRATKPPYERLLQGDDAKRAAELFQKTFNAEQADQYDKAIEHSEELLSLRTKIQGAEHWETLNDRWSLDARRKVAALSAAERADWRKAFQAGLQASRLDAAGQSSKAAPLWQQYYRKCVQVLGEKHPETATAANNFAANLEFQGNYGAAQQLCQQALDVRRELLGEKHPFTATSYNNLAGILNRQGKYAEAQPLYRKALELCVELLGDKNPETALSYNNVAFNLNAQAKYAEAQPLYEKSLGLFRELLGERHPNTATSYNNLALNLDAQAKYADALPLFQKALDLRRELLGEKHPDTAASYDNLAGILSTLGKYADALPLTKKALDIRREVLGEKHPDTAGSYNNLANNLNSQANYADAQPLFQKALDIRREVLGEQHPFTALSYNSLGNNLYSQGKYAEAMPLFQKALASYLGVFGDKHPDTASTYNNLAENLNAQGKYAEALPFFQKALDLRRELLGDKHPDTATSYGSLAANLHAQAHLADALPLFRKSLDLRREFLGEKHPETARSYNNLAANLAAQGNHAEAQLLYQKAHDLNIELIGEKHYHTAASYNNLGTNLCEQGKYGDALPLYRKALALHVELLGEKHPKTASSYANVAGNLMVQGKYADAAELFMRATASYEAARWNVAVHGLDRAIFGANQSPYRSLAATRVHLNSHEAAWVAAENDLARGLSDEVVFLSQATLTPDEQKRRTTLSTRLDQLQPRILQLVSKQSPTEVETDELAALQSERNALEADLAELATMLSRREVATFAVVQSAIPADAALILWIDAWDRGGGVSEHWGCVVRHAGAPSWERLPGTGANSQWTDDDMALPDQLRAALASSNTAKVEIDGLAHELYVQRLAPLARHVAGLKTLYIACGNLMGGVPVEVLTREFTISYVPSGTHLAKLAHRNPASQNGLLALGDPVFKRRDASSRPAPSSDLPPGGMLITMLDPAGPAAKARLQPGDVLLRYGEADINSYEQLVAAIQGYASSKEVSISVWREGEKQPFTRTVPPGRLGVALDKEPARESIANRRRTDALLATLRGSGWSELPGTRVEVTHLAKLFGDRATTLLDSSASEQSLDNLRRKRELSKYRYLHLATHGQADDKMAFESALILAQDKLPEFPLPRAGEPFINGQLSANEVLEFWELNADLVTLSACETAIGRKGGGDGLLGFAQAFLTKGSRAVCLSLWKVDDTATALLMTRFYQNLLGKREGLNQPMPKARALAEAKEWLRELSAVEAEKLTAAAISGVVRPSRGKGDDVKLALPAANPKLPAGAESKPFAHPRFWSAFILIGDPN